MVFKNKTMEIFGSVVSNISTTLSEYKISDIEIAINEELLVQRNTGYKEECLQVCIGDVGVSFSIKEDDSVQFLFWEANGGVHGRFFDLKSVKETLVMLSQFKNSYDAWDVEDLDSPTPSLIANLLDM